MPKRLVDDGDGPRPTAWHILGLAGDPTPGDPGEVINRREDWYGLADDLDRAYPGVVTLLTDDAIVGWLGKSGDAFRGACEPFPGELTTLSNACRAAGAALDTWYSKLNTFQLEADAQWGEVEFELRALGFTDLGALAPLAGTLDDTAYMLGLTRLVPQFDPGKTDPSGGSAPALAYGSNPFPAATPQYSAWNNILKARRTVEQAAVDYASAARQTESALSDAGARLAPMTAPHMVGGTEQVTFDTRFSALGGDLADLVLPEAAVADLSGAGFDRAKVDALSKALQDAEANGDWSVVAGLNQQILDLSPAELELFMEETSDDALKRWLLLMWQGDFAKFDFSSTDRRDFLNALLAKLPAGQWAKFETDFPGYMPNWYTTDVYTNRVQAQRQEQVDGIHWGVPDEPLFSQPPSYLDVQQGQLGDCWYLSSLIGVTLKNPQFIQDGIHQNPNGTISVRIWDKSGTMKWVTVTPELPVDSNGTPIGAIGANGDLWPAYYEKAFALEFDSGKEGAEDAKGNSRPFDPNDHGDYGAIEWNNVTNAEPYLTGHGDTGIDDNLTAVRKSFDAGHPIVVGSRTDISPDDVKKLPPPLNNGYVPKHVFYVKEFTQDGKVVLGNPWGPNNPTLTVDDDMFKKYFQGPEALNIQ